MPAQERWILQELRSIGSTDSVQAILQEIVRYPLRRVVDSDNLDASKYVGPALEIPADLFLLSHGWLNRQNYLVSVPDLSYFVDKLSSVTFEQATLDPIAFLRAHWRQVPRSVKVDHYQQQLIRIENALIDVQFRNQMEHMMVHLTGDSLAFAISTSVGTSPEVSIFIAGCFGIVAEVMLNIRKQH